jgi:hypothetical protein
VVYLVIVDKPLYRSSDITYAVTVTPSIDGVVNVRRRFNDFVWLRELLVKLFPGVFLPPMAPKGILNFNKDDLMAERPGDLARFMNRLAQLPHIASHTAFQFFLTWHGYFLSSAFVVSPMCFLDLSMLGYAVDLPMVGI